MKHSFNFSFLLVFALLVSIKTYSYDFEVNGIYYGYNSDSQTAYVTNGDQQYSGSVIIPTSVTFNGRTLNVTSIGQKAFYRCYSVESVSIPNSVTRIESSAFEGCGLKSVDISKGVTTIGSFAFSYSYLTKVYIPNSVTIIDGFAFQPCSQLETLIIEDSETPIEYLDYFSFLNSQSSEETIPKYVYIGRDCYSQSGYLSPIHINCSNAIILSIGKYVKRVEASSSVAKTIYSASEVPEDVEVNFNGSIYANAKLYVPTGTKEKYMSAKGWKNFFLIEEMDVDKMWNGKGDPNGYDQEKNKCEKPTISYANGKLTFSSATPNAICQSTITDTDISSFSGNEVQLTVTYTIKVYATASGYENSDVVTATLCWIDADPKTEGIENGVAQVRANAVLIQSHDGTLSIAGVADGTDITVYSVSGQMVGSAKAHGTTSDVTTTLSRGNVAIVRIGDKSVKVVMQ